MVFISLTGSTAGGRRDGHADGLFAHAHGRDQEWGHQRGSVSWSSEGGREGECTRRMLTIRRCKMCNPNPAETLWCWEDRPKCPLFASEMRPCVARARTHTHTHIFDILSFVWWHNSVALADQLAGLRRWFSFSLNKGPTYLLLILNTKTCGLRKHEHVSTVDAITLSNKSLFFFPTDSPLIFSPRKSSGRILVAADVPRLWHPRFLQLSVIFAFLPHCRKKPTFSQSEHKMFPLATAAFIFSFFFFPGRFMKMIH